MWINYPAQIQESVEILVAQERRLRQSAVADRVKMLRLLKSGRYRSQCQLASLLGRVIGPYVGGGRCISSRAWLA